MKFGTELMEGLCMCVQLFAGYTVLSETVERTSVKFEMGDAPHVLFISIFGGAVFTPNKS